MRELRSRLTYANVISTLCLVLILGGGAAYAANTVSSTDIINGEVRSIDIGTNQVASSDLANDSVNQNKIVTGGVRSAEVANESLGGSDIDEGTLNGGGDVSGPLSNLQIAPRSIGRAELASGAGQGCCVISFFEFTVPADSCETKTVADSQADLGDIILTYPESASLGSGVYMSPTVVAQAGEIVLEWCNTTGSDVTIPFGTFFQIRFIG